MPTATLDRPPVGVTTEILTVTPEIAAEMLEHNDDNRRFRGTLAATYARHMRAGRWRFTGDPIQFSETGKLLNGQHRLSAIVQSGETCQFLVVRGLPDEAQQVMDIGSKRTTADALALIGQPGGRVLSAVATMILTEAGTIKQQVTTPEIIEAIRENPLIAWAVEMAGTIRIQNVTPTVVGYVYYRLALIDTDRAHSFFTSLIELTGLPHGSPILALHRRLAGEKSKPRTTAYRQETVALIFMAWNAWVRGETREIIKLARNASGRLSMPEPVAS
jgi:hypothetical protein